MRNPMEIVEDYLSQKYGDDSSADRGRIVCASREPDLVMLRFLESYPGREALLNDIRASMTEEEAAQQTPYLESAVGFLLEDANNAFLHPFFSDELRDELGEQGVWNFTVLPEEYEEKNFLSMVMRASELRELWYPGEKLEDAVEALQTRCDRIPFWPEELGLNLDFCSKEQVADALVERAVELQEGEVLTPEMEEVVRERTPEQPKEAMRPRTTGLHR